MPRSASRLRSAAPSSSAVESRTVAKRQCSTSSSPSKVPKWVCVLPTSTTRSIARGIRLAPPWPRPSTPSPRRTRAPPSSGRCSSRASTYRRVDIVAGRCTSRPARALRRLDRARRSARGRRRRSRLAGDRPRAGGALPGAAAAAGRRGGARRVSSAPSSGATRCSSRSPRRHHLVRAPRARRTRCVATSTGAKLPLPPTRARCSARRSSSRAAQRDQHAGDDDVRADLPHLDSHLGASTLDRRRRARRRAGQRRRPADRLEHPRCCDARRPHAAARRAPGRASSRAAGSPTTRGSPRRSRSRRPGSRRSSAPERDRAARAGRPASARPARRRRHVTPPHDPPGFGLPGQRQRVAPPRTPDRRPAGAPDAVGELVADSAAGERQRALARALPAPRALRRAGSAMATSTTMSGSSAAAVSATVRSGVSAPR